MKNLLIGSMSLLAVIGTIACGKEEPPPAAIEAELKDSDDALTDDGGDALFTIDVKEIEEALDVEKLLVRANLPEGDPVELVFEHTDADEDGKLSKGDSLSVSEGDVNVFGAAQEEAVEIELLKAAEEEDGEPESLATLEWEPAAPAEEE